jgi:hypothetical protein
MLPPPEFDHSATQAVPSSRSKASLWRRRARLD